MPTRSLIESPVHKITKDQQPDQTRSQAIIQRHLNGDLCQKTCDDIEVLWDEAINIIVIESNSLDLNEGPSYPASLSDHSCLHVLQRSGGKAAQPYDIQKILNKDRSP